MLIESLERRTLLSANVVSIATFTGANGFSPAAMVEDANKNVYGVTTFTQSGQNVQSGEIFKIPAGTGTIQVLATFPTTSLISPASLIIDSSGNLYGTENGDPTNGGKVFELPAGASSVITLGTFPLPGQGPLIGTQGTVTGIDSSGNLFGFDNVGNAFEVVHGSGAVTNLATLYGTANGSLRDLEFGPDGMLYGAADHAVVQINPANGQITQLATLDTATTGNAPTGLTVDSAGNIWGLCTYGGANGNGVIWALPAGSHTLTVVNNLTSATGYRPVGRPVFDTKGQLFAITSIGGTSDDGTLLSIPAGSNPASATTPVVNVNFTSDEQDPASGAGMVINSAGVAAGISTSGNDLPFYGALWGGFAPADVGAIHPNVLSGYGQLLDLIEIGTTPGVPPLQMPKATALEGWHGKMLQAISNHTPIPPLPTTFLVHPSSKSTRNPQVAAILKSLATFQKKLLAATALCRKQITYNKQYYKEAGVITALQAKIAAKSTPALQKQLNAATALQTKALNQDIAVYNTIIADWVPIDQLGQSIYTQSLSI